MFEIGSARAFEFGNNFLGKHFAQLDAPLIERINVPNRPLRENAVLVQRNERAQHFGREFIGENDIARTIAFKRPMRHEPIGCAFRFDLLCRFPERQRFRLGENVRH